MKEHTERPVLRPHAEEQWAEELALLRKEDQAPRPPGWQLSPPAVVTYLMGGRLPSGAVIEPKYFGKRQLIELAVATLVTDRALLLVGLPGTAKTWVSEHLAAAISGDSTLLVQGTSGLGEEALRYGWNYALLIARGPSPEALVPSPVMKAMQDGKIVRVEELTRITPEVQDALITLLSEKVLPIPELNSEVKARKGFNLIATANDRDRGVHELSGALRRRFNTIVMPFPASLKEEVHIVKTRVEALGKTLDLPPATLPLKEITRLVTIFRELRAGQTEDGKLKLKSPTATLSTAEAISVLNQGWALAAHFGSGRLGAPELAAALPGALLKDPQRDAPVWSEYLETVVKQRKGWEDLYAACRAAHPPSNPDA